MTASGCRRTQIDVESGLYVQVERQERNSQGLWSSSGPHLKAYIWTVQLQHTKNAHCAPHPHIPCHISEKFYIQIVEAQVNVIFLRMEARLKSGFTGVYFPFRKFSWMLWVVVSSSFSPQQPLRSYAEQVVGRLSRDEIWNIFFKEPSHPPGLFSLIHNLNCRWSLTATGMLLDELDGAGENATEGAGFCLPACGVFGKMGSKRAWEAKFGYSSLI